MEHVAKESDESVEFCLFSVADTIVHHILGLDEAMKKEDTGRLTATSALSTDTTTTSKVNGTRQAQEEIKSSSSLSFLACLFLIIL